MQNCKVILSLKAKSWRGLHKNAANLCLHLVYCCTVACSSRLSATSGTKLRKVFSIVQCCSSGLELEFNNRAHGSNKINGRKLGTGTEMKEKMQRCSSMMHVFPGYWGFDKRWKGSLRSVKIFVFCFWLSQQGKRNWSINWNMLLLDSHLLSKKSYGKKYIFIRNIYVQSTSSKCSQWQHYHSAY